MRKEKLTLYWTGEYNTDRLIKNMGGYWSNQENGNETRKTSKNPAPMSAYSVMYVLALSTGDRDDTYNTGGISGAGRNELFPCGRDTGWVQLCVSAENRGVHGMENRVYSI